MNSREYWRKREAEARANVINNEDRYNRVLMQYYDDLQDSIQKEIDGFYGRYATKEGITLSDAKKRASNIDIRSYANKAKKYVAEKDFSAQANQEMRLYNLTMKVNRLELLKANIGLEMINTYNGLEHFYEKTLSNEVLNTYNRLSGVMGQITNPSAKKVSSIVNASFKGANFSENIWANQSMLKSRLSNLLVNGLVTGKSARELAPKLAKEFNTEKYQAQRLLRTELTRVRMDAQIDSIKQNGFDEYEYVAFSANRACPDCQPLDGKHFPVEKFQPGDNAPPMHPNCRCSIAAYSGVDTDLQKYYEETKPLKNEWLKNRAINIPNSRDKNQYERYVSILGASAIGSYTDFIQTKYTDKDNWDEIKSLTRSKNYTQAQVNYVENGKPEFIPAHAKFDGTPITIAGGDTGIPFKLAEKYAKKYGGNPKDWSKRVVKIRSKKYSFDVHWVEYSGIQYDMKVKNRKERS